MSLTQFSIYQFSKRSRMVWSQGCCLIVQMSQEASRCKETPRGQCKIKDRRILDNDGKCLWPGWFLNQSTKSLKLDLTGWSKAGGHYSFKSGRALLSLQWLDTRMWTHLLCHDAKIWLTATSYLSGRCRCGTHLATVLFLSQQGNVFVPFCKSTLTWHYF